MAPHKRKAATLHFQPSPPEKKKKLDGPASTLVPIGERKRAQKGVKDERMLHMLCDDTKTGKQKELHFKKIVHAQIDWNSSEDIAKINSWRNQLYGRAGFKAKTVIMWHEDEEAYLELYYHLLIAEGTEHGLMIPRAKDVLNDFNDFFAGKSLVDSDDEDLVPREARKHNAFVSKMNRVIVDVKHRLETMLLGKPGDYFRPRITEGMLTRYKELKQAVLYENGIEREIFSWNIGKDGKNDWENNNIWVKFLQNIPRDDNEDDEMLDAELEATLQELDVREHMKVEDFSDDEGRHNLDMSPSVGMADVETGTVTSNETTFMEGDTGLTEPDSIVIKTEESIVQVKQVSYDKVTVAKKTNEGECSNVTDIDVHVDSDVAQAADALMALSYSTPNIGEGA